jgi:hypothetical protein
MLGYMAAEVVNHRPPRLICPIHKNFRRVSGR